MPPVAKPSWVFSLLAALTACAVTAVAQQGVATKRLTPTDEYTGLVEGPAVDRNGNLYVVNFGKDGIIGQIKAGETKSEPFATLPALPPKKGEAPVQSKASGIRFDRSGRMYVAAFNTHRIFVFEPNQTPPVPLVYLWDNFNQPNDLAIAADGTLYASDPRRKNKTGQIWRITREPNGEAKGQVMTSNRQMGITNGLDLSPDDQTLYVSESVTGKIWAYRIDGNALKNEEMLVNFGSDVDGLRVDADGTIFVARPDDGVISVLRPDKTKLPQIKTEGKTPNNLTFGGADGRTVFVTQVVQKPNPKNNKGYVETFRAERPGREFCKQFGGTHC